MTLSPIIIFVYKRLWHTQQTLEALRNNRLADKSDLYIYSDYPKDEKAKEGVKAVRDYLKSINGFKKINTIKRERHFGLANSIISGVTEVINKYGKVVVLEDDLVSSPNFLRFMNEALDFYEEDKRIFSVTGYTHPIAIPESYKEQVYLYYRCCSWGWGTWVDRWEKADWQIKDYLLFKNNQKARERFNRGGDDLSTLMDFQMRGKIDSWAIRWCYTLFKNNAYCLYPTVSKIRNIGQDGSGTHFSIRRTKTLLDESNENPVFQKNLQINEEILRNLNRHFRYDLQRKILHIVQDAIDRIALFVLPKAYDAK